MLTGNTRPHYGRMPGVHPRAMKQIYLEDKFAVDGETATQLITIGFLIQREQFVDSLPDVICYEGVEGMEKAFSEWLKEKK